MSFHEVRFPTTVSYGASGGPERQTDIVTLANGFEERNTNWAHSRRRYDAGLGMTNLDQLEQVNEQIERDRMRIQILYSLVGAGVEITGDETAWLNLGVLWHHHVRNHKKAAKAYRQYLNVGGKDDRVRGWLKEIEK